MIGALFNQYLVKRISELRKKDIISTHKLFCVISFICMSITYIYCGFTNRISDIILLDVLVWLGSVAYFDRISGYVFCAMEYYAILPVSAALIRLCFICDKPMMLAGCLIANGLYIIILKLTAKKGLFGEGDSDVLSIISVCVHLMYVEYSPVYDMYDMMFADLTVFFLASLLFFVRNIKNIRFRSMRLKIPRPFVPDIYIAYVIYYFTFLVK